jgi:hypothetical protein
MDRVAAVNLDQALIEIKKHLRPPGEVLTVKGKTVDKEDIEALYQGMRSIANSITPPVAGNVDATGGYVSSLTEAVMGHTRAVVRVAEALESIAEALRERD